MNRFKNTPNKADDFDPRRDDQFYDLRLWLDPLGLSDCYQDLYDMLSDDYRGGYHGHRKAKLLLYIQHRAFREYGVVIHTGNGFSPFDAEDTHHGDPADITGLCEDYDAYEKESVLEFLAGIR